jgi:Tfp pilus assembly protein PilO
MKTRLHISGQTAVTGVGQLIMLALLALAAVALYAPIRQGRELRRELEEARRRLANLEILYPLYAEVSAMDQPSNWAGLPAPAMSRLAEPEVVTVPERFMTLAGACGFELSAISPQVGKEDSGLRYLRVDIRGHGAYDQLKNFLMQVAGMPVLKRIQKLELRREARQEQMHLIADLSLD